jgi:hypothetical protein
MKAKWFAVLVAILFVGLMTNAAIAKTGGVKVDSDSDCTNGTEANVLSCGTTGYIQINASSDNFDPSVACQICPQGKGQSCYSIECDYLTQCTNGGATYFVYTFTVPVALGTQTLAVNNVDSGKNVGADSFKVSCLL